MILGPSTTVPNGERDARGRFAPGNKAARGNPLARRVARLRAELVRRCSPDDMGAVADRLIAMAKEGDIAAIRELLTRILGKPIEADLLARIEALEAANEQRQNR